MRTLNVIISYQLFLIPLCIEFSHILKKIDRRPYKIDLKRRKNVPSELSISREGDREESKAEEEALNVVIIMIIIIIITNRAAARMGAATVETKP